MSVVVAQSGELDVGTIDGLVGRLGPHRRPGGHVVLDLREVTFMDCFSLGQILGAYAASATEGWKLDLLVGTPQVRRLLDLTGAGRLLPLPVAP